MHLPTLKAGDIITVAARVVEDHGDDVVIAFHATRGDTHIQVQRSNIIAISKTQPVTDRVSPL